MATIGLDKLYYATITEDANGNETYGTPMQLAKAISASLSIEVAEAILHADDGPAYAMKEFKSGKITLGVDDIGATAAQALTGATVDANNVLVSTDSDTSAPVAIGFRAKKANGKYRYFWLYRVLFSVPETSLATKGDSISFSTPTIEGIISRRNRVDAQNKNPWKAEADEGAIVSDTITGWYTSVYEPTYTVVTPTPTPEPEEGE